MENQNNFTYRNTSTKIKRILANTLIVSTITVTTLTGCGGKKTEETTTPAVTTVATTAKTTVATTKATEPVVEVDPNEGKSINPLTGLYVDEALLGNRPFAVTISNIKSALPQSGISEADVIYETLAEGGIPRLVAVFNAFEGEKIGPIRSGRHYFIDFAFDFDAVLIHYGKSTHAQKAFKTLNSEHIDGLYDDDMTYQDPNRNRPHATFATKETLIDAVGRYGYRLEEDPDFTKKLVFSEEEVNLDGEENVEDHDAQKVAMKYSYYITSTFEYDEKEKVYNRFQYGNKHIDIENNEQLKFKNIIIQFTSMWAIKGDEYGCLDMDLLTTGKGYYVTNGKYMPITWKKDSHNGPTQYFTEDDKPLEINKGKTWIAVFPSYNSDKVKFSGKE